RRTQRAGDSRRAASPTRRQSFRWSSYLKTDRDGLLDARDKFVEGARLGVASAQRGDRSDVIPLLVTLHDHGEIALHMGPAAAGLVRPSLSMPRLVAGLAPCLHPVSAHSGPVRR